MAKKKAVKKKKEAVKAPWDELRIYRDGGSVSFDLVFYGRLDSYVSEIYGVDEDETPREAAIEICHRYGWFDKRPGGA